VNVVCIKDLALLRNPSQWARLAADATLIPDAIEELLRYDSPVQMTNRFAYEACTLGAHSIDRGALVLMLLGAANRDPAVFVDPARLDVTRENAHANLAFGNGVHYCLGAPLARVEGEIAFGALLRRLPRLTLADEPLEWRENVVLRGLRSLRVMT
jgi:pimeloyl-[acyl-carrier protein] synthase